MFGSGFGKGQIESKELKALSDREDVEICATHLSYCAKGYIEPTIIDQVGPHSDLAARSCPTRISANRVGRRSNFL
jgi:hypothetical protein